MKSNKKSVASKSSSKAATIAEKAAPAAKVVGSKIGLVCDLLDVAKTPHALTIREIIDHLTKAAKAGQIKPTQNDQGAKGFDNPQTVSSINAMAVPSWSRHQGRLFRYAKTTQQGEPILNVTTQTIQGIAPGERMTNTTLVHAFGPHAKAPSVIEADAWSKLGHTTVNPIAEMGEIVARAKAEKVKAAKSAKAATKPTPAKAAGAAKAGSAKGGAAAKAVAAIRATAPARQRAAKAPATA